MAGNVVDQKETSSRREGPSRIKLGGSTTKSTRRKKVPVEQQQQYVGIDLHRRRSVIVRRIPEGVARR